MRSAVLCLLAACSPAPKTYGPTYDGGADGATDTGADVASQQEAGVDAASDAAVCSSIVALVGGNATSLFAGGGALSSVTASSLSGTLADCGNDFGCASPVAIARLSTGLLAVLAASNGSLASTVFQSSWADPAPIATAKTIDGPALAVMGSSAHLLFQGADYKYLHAIYTLSGWDSASDPVGGSGSSQSFGARGPAVAATGADLVALQAGSDSYLYDQGWTGSWQGAHKQGAAIQNTLPPAIVALTGGASELMAAYLRNGDYKVMAVDRKSGAWNTTPTLIDTAAYANDPVALAALPGGKALLVFRGSDKKPYFSTWDGSSTWTAPAPVATTNPAILSTPSIAPGVCGADAIVAWAESGGGVSVATFTGSAFAKPVAISGTSGAKFVAIATLP